MSVAEKRMLHSDAFAWYMEDDPVLRSTVVAIVRMDRSPDWDRLRERIDRLTKLAPVLRMRVQVPPLRIGPPRWSVDEAFDLDYHLRRIRVRDGGSWPEVLEFARTAAMSDFDRARPLWEFTLLEGMADGGSALVTKLHHSLTDGIGGVQLAALVVDPGPESPKLEPPPRAPQGHSLSTIELAARSVTDEAAEFSAAAARMIRSAPGNLAHAVRHPREAAQDAGAAMLSIARFVVPVNHASSTVLGERRIGRQLATMDVAVSELHAAAALGGGHLNDAFLAALVSGLHRYHERRGADLPRLHVIVPVSVRTDHDAVGGNRITLIRVTLPGELAEPAERIAQIAAVMRRWRHEPALNHTQPIAFGLNLLPRAYLGGMFKRVELLASDVPGIPQRVWLAGAEINGYYGFGPTIGAGLNATLMSYAGTCNIGVNVDLGAVDRPELLLECLHEGVAEVVALAHAPRPRKLRHRAARGTGDEVVIGARTQREALGRSGADVEHEIVVAPHLVEPSVDVERASV